MVLELLEKCLAFLELLNVVSTVGLLHNFLSVFYQLIDLGLSLLFDPFNLVRFKLTMVTQARIYLFNGVVV